METNLIHGQQNGRRMVCIVSHDISISLYVGSLYLKTLKRSIFLNNSILDHEVDELQNADAHSIGMLQQLSQETMNIPEESIDMKSENKTDKIASFRSRSKISRISEFLRFAESEELKTRANKEIEGI